jgi:hypothetical protein
MYIDHSQWNIPSDCQPDDPNFKQPGRIDLLLFAEVFYDIVTCEKSAKKGHPALVNALPGWILSGRIPPVSCKNSSRRATTCFKRI